MTRCRLQYGLIHWRLAQAVTGCVCTILFFTISLAHGADLKPAEFQAAFLAKSLSYVAWPADRNPPPGDPFVVGLFGGDPFDGLLQKLLENQKINERRVVVKVIAEASARDCHIIFVPADRAELWLASNPEVPYGVLVVGADDTGGFARTGGVLNLRVAERSLELNPKNARKAGLEINSKLIKIARIVR